MIVLVTGERDHPRTKDVAEVMEDLQLDKQDLVITGGAKGVDQSAATWCRKEGVPFVVMTVAFHEWAKLGKAAGPARNEAMISHPELRKPDLVVAFTAPQIRGTKDMINRARRDGIELRFVRRGQDDWDPGTFRG